jgi:aryl-alcohol dehydrogenase-like predicted oxidoreductase
MEDGMRTLTLGTDGPAVSALCLGAMRFGTRTDPATSRAILDRYLAAGGGFLDTANIYASWEPGGRGGDSERLLGEWLRERDCRERVFLATKVGSKLQPSGRGLRPEQIAREFAGCRDRLGVAAVDLLYAHFDDPAGTPIAATMAAFGRLLSAGEVRQLGASNFLAWRLEAVRRTIADQDLPMYCCLQARHSYLRPDPWDHYGTQEPATPEVLAWCAAHGVRVLAYSPLLGGCYGGRADRPVPRQYDHPRNHARLAVLRGLARDKGVTPEQLVLAWLLAGPAPVIPIVGCSSVAQLDEALAALDIVLAPDELAHLDAAGWELASPS